MTLEAESGSAALRRRLGELLRDNCSVHRRAGKPDVFVLSTPRSGSTWLLETIAAEKGMRSCNEPFNLRKPAVVRRLGIDSWEALAADSALPAIERYLRAISGGRPGFGFKNPRPFEHGYNLVSRRVVFKLLFACEDRLAWLKERFDAQIVVLVRHPIPVSLSRQELPRLRALLASPVAELLTGAQRSFAEAIIASGTPLEQAQVDWCLQNLPLIRSRALADVFLTYEQMVLEPELIVEHLIDRLQLASADAVRASVSRLSGSVSKSSAQSRRLLEGRDRDRFSLISKWRDQLDAEREQSLMRVLEVFELDVYAPGRVEPSAPYLLGAYPQRRCSGRDEVA